MKDFFAALYEIFINVYGGDLAEHLYGVDCIGNVETGWYASIGLTLLVFTLGFVLFYYYIYVNPSRSRWFNWLKWLILNFLIQFLIGFYLPYRDLQKGLICETFEVSTSNTIFFGLVNALLSAILFVALSFLLRWWSTDGKLTPIPR